MHLALCATSLRLSTNLQFTHSDCNSILWLQVVNEAGILATKQGPADAFSSSDSPTMLAAVRPKAHFLSPDSLPEVNAPGTPGSTPSTPGTASATPGMPTAGAQAENSALSFLGRGNAASLPRRVLRAYLAVEMLLEVQQAVKKQLAEGGPKVLTVVKSPKSPSKSAPKAQKSHLALDMTAANAGKTGSQPTAVATVEGANEVVSLPSTEAGLSAQHKSGLAVADSIDAEFLAAQKSAHLTARKAFNFTMQGSWRLLWLALMGDASYWQEAMHLLESRKRGGRFFALPLLVFLQAVAFSSQVTVPVDNLCVATKPIQYQLHAAAAMQVLFSDLGIHSLSEHDCAQCHLPWLSSFSLHTAGHVLSHGILCRLN